MLTVSLLANEAQTTKCSE